MDTFYLDLADGVFKNIILMCAVAFIVPRGDYLVWGLAYMLSAVVFFSWEYAYNQIKFSERLNRVLAIYNRST